jgi:nitroreductase/NAD-dependent dihydropyrimidine dehydrogenase PreA subunit
MSWVTINQDKCNECGLCVLRCASCFSLENETITAHADMDCCIECGHCVSLCPADAIVHEKMDMENFIAVDREVDIDTDSFIKFVRKRRSHRHFKDKIIPKKDIEKLIDTCRYAPTGGNLQGVELMVIQDQGKIKELSDLTIDFFNIIGTSAQTQVAELPSGESASKKAESLQRMINYKERFIQARDLGYDPIFHKAPAVIIFHSHLQAASAKDDCVIASTTMGLAAMTMGLGTTYIGLYEAAAKNHPPANDALNLPPEHGVFSVLIMGYPKLKYLKTVDRNPIKTTWV